MKPYISVVIPAFNEERTLTRCLESIDRQVTTYPFEVLVADNNSSDSTAAVAKKHGARVVPAPIQGVCAARQAGLAASLGEIIISTDADCMYLPDWLENIGQVFERQSDVSLLVGNYRFENGPKWANPCLRAYEWLAMQFNNAFNLKIYVSAANLAFRKQDFKGYDTNMTQGGDELYVLRHLKQKGRVLYRFTNPIKTSNRRLKQGFIKTLFGDFLIKYLVNYIRTSKTGINYAGTYRPHRELENAGINRLNPILKTTCVLVIVFLLVCVIYGVIKLIIIFLGLSVPVLVGYISLMTGLAAYATFAPHSQLAGPQPFRVRTQKKVVAITFDDGPNGQFTRDIADYIYSYGGRATFFQVGDNIDRSPEITRYLHDQGHLIGNHTAHHRFTDYFKPGWKTNIDTTSNVIYDACGAWPRYVRLPWLFRLPWLLSPLYKSGLQPVAGTFVYLSEYRQPDGVMMARRRADKVKPGDILIMHDGYNAKGGDRRETVRAVAELCRRLDARGFEFVRIDELL